MLRLCNFTILFSLITTAFCLNAYQDGSNVDVFVNKVGPYFNPHETYHYYTLPVCRPTKIEHRSLTLGEVLDGDRMAYSMYSIKFKQNRVDATLCSKKLDEKELNEMKEAVEELYYFEMVVDDLPVRGFIGRSLLLPLS